MQLLEMLIISKAIDRIISKLVWPLRAFNLELYLVILQLQLIRVENRKKIFCAIKGWMQQWAVWRRSACSSAARSWYQIGQQLAAFFDKTPSFEAREANWYLNNRLGMFRATTGCLLASDLSTREIGTRISYSIFYGSRPAENVRKQKTARIACRNFYILIKNAKVDLFCPNFFSILRTY